MLSKIISLIFTLFIFIFFISIILIIVRPDIFFKYFMLLIFGKNKKSKKIVIEQKNKNISNDFSDYEIIDDKNAKDGQHTLQ